MPPALPEPAVHSTPRPGENAKLVKEAFELWFRAMDDGTVFEWAELVMTPDAQWEFRPVWGSRHSARGPREFCEHYNKLVQLVWGGPGTNVTWSPVSMEELNECQVRSRFRVAFPDNPAHPLWMRLYGRPRRLEYTFTLTAGKVSHAIVSIGLPDFCGDEQSGPHAVDFASTAIQCLCVGAVHSSDPQSTEDWAGSVLSEDAECSFPGQEPTRGRAGFMDAFRAMCVQLWGVGNCPQQSVESCRYLGDKRVHVQVCCAPQKSCDGQMDMWKIVYVITLGDGMITGVEVNLQQQPATLEDSPPALLPELPEAEHSPGCCVSGVDFGSEGTEKEGIDVVALAKEYNAKSLAAMEAGSFAHFIESSLAPDAEISQLDECGRFQTKCLSSKDGIVRAYNILIHDICELGGSLSPRFFSVEKLSDSSVRVRSILHVLGSTGLVLRMELETLEMTFDAAGLITVFNSTRGALSEQPILRAGRSEAAATDEHRRCAKMLLDSQARAMDEGAMNQWFCAACHPDVHFEVTLPHGAGAASESAVGWQNCIEVYNRKQTEREMMMPGVAQMVLHWVDIEKLSGGWYRATQDATMKLEGNLFLSNVEVQMRKVLEYKLVGGLIYAMKVKIQYPSAPSPPVPVPDATIAPPPGELPQDPVQAVRQGLACLAEGAAAGVAGLAEVLSHLASPSVEVQLTNGGKAIGFQQVAELLASQCACAPPASSTRLWSVTVPVQAGSGRYCWVDAIRAGDMPTTRTVGTLDVTLADGRFAKAVLTVSQITASFLSSSVGLAVSRSLYAAAQTGTIAQLAEAVLTADVVVCAEDYTMRPGSVVGGTSVGIRDLCLRYNAALEFAGAELELCAEEVENYTQGLKAEAVVKMSIQPGRVATGIGFPAHYEVHTLTLFCHGSRANHVRLTVTPVVHRPDHSDETVARKCAVSLMHMCLLSPADAARVAETWAPQLLRTDAVCVVSPTLRLEGECDSECGGTVVRGLRSFIDTGGASSSLAALLGASRCGRLAWRLESTQAVQSDVPGTRGLRVTLLTDNGELQQPGMRWAIPPPSAVVCCIDIALHGDSVSVVSATATAFRVGGNAREIAGHIPPFAAAKAMRALQKGMPSAPRSSLATPESPGRPSAGPIAGIPCLHNAWDSVRIKRGWVILRCRTCSQQWRVDVEVLAKARCEEFDQGSCQKPSCERLHVWRRKLKESERGVV